MSFSTYEGAMFANTRRMDDRHHALGHPSLVCGRKRNSRDKRGSGSSTSKGLAIVLCVHLVEDSPAVLSLGVLCETMGHSCPWKTGEQPSLTQHGITYQGRSENHVSGVAVTRHQSTPTVAVTRHQSTPTVAVRLFARVVTVATQIITLQP